VSPGTSQTNGHTEESTSIAGATQRDDTTTTGGTQGWYFNATKYAIAVHSSHAYLPAEFSTHVTDLDQGASPLKLSTRNITNFTVIAPHCESMGYIRNPKDVFPRLEQINVLLDVFCDLSDSVIDDLATHWSFVNEVRINMAQEYRNNLTVSLVKAIERLPKLTTIEFLDLASEEVAVCQQHPTTRTHARSRSIISNARSFLGKRLSKIRGSEKLRALASSKSLSSPARIATNATLGVNEAKLRQVKQSLTSLVDHLSTHTFKRATPLNIVIVEPRFIRELTAEQDDEWFKHCLGIGAMLKQHLPFVKEISLIKVPHPNLAKQSTQEILAWANGKFERYFDPRQLLPEPLDV